MQVFPEGNQPIVFNNQARDDLPAHMKGRAYWVDFENSNRLAYHMQDNQGNETIVEFINNAWYIVI